MRHPKDEMHKKSVTVNIALFLTRRAPDRRSDGIFFLIDICSVLLEELAVRPPGGLKKQSAAVIS
jgi:hypothetical protein